jgi:hypothetical protein
MPILIVVLPDLSPNVIKHACQQMHKSASILSQNFLIAGFSLANPVVPEARLFFAV